MRHVFVLAVLLLVLGQAWWRVAHAVSLTRTEHGALVLAEHGLRRCDGEGVVVGLSPSADGARVVVQTGWLHCDGWPGPHPGGLIALYTHEAGLLRGDVLRYVADVGPLEVPRGLALASSWPRVARLGALRSGTALYVERLAEGRGPYAWVDRLRQRAQRTLAAALPRDVEPLALALVLGTPPEDRELAEDFRVSGLAHLLAVSGAHLTLVVGGFVYCTRKLLSRIAVLAARYDVGRMAAIVGALAAPFYADFSGNSGSAWRAASMSMASLLATALGIRLVAQQAWTLGLIALALCAPLLLCDVGTQLSLLASAALVFGSPLLATRLPWTQTARWRPFSTQAVVSVAVAPLVFHLGPKWSAFSLALNLVAIPFGELLALPATLFCSLAGGIPWVGPLAARVSSGSLRVVALLAHLGATHGVVAPPDPISWARARHRDLEIRHLDVGQGDATLLRLPSGEVMLIDAGGRVGPGPDPGERTVAPTLRSLGIYRVDVAIVSHPHPDHEGGLLAALRDVQVGEVWDSGEANLRQPGSSYVAALHALAERGARLRGPREVCGVHTLGTVRITVLAPCTGQAMHEHTNDNSIVVRVDYGMRRFLFVGDAEQAEEQELLALPTELRADVLKVGHHGSRTSSHEAFLAAVAPGFAVISSGVRNRFGHPTAEALARLAARPGIRVLRTDVCGEVMWRTDGLRLEAQVAEPACLQSPPAPEAQRDRKSVV